MTTAEPVRDAMPAFDGAQNQCQERKGGWRGGEGRAEGGPVSARLRKGHF